MTYFNALSQYSPRMTEEDRITVQTVKSISDRKEQFLNASQPCLRPVAALDSTSEMRFSVSQNIRPKMNVNSDVN